MASFRARTCSFAQAWGLAASGSPISKVGCAPLSKKPALEEACRRSSGGTGPAPEGGGRNGPGVATQPTAGLGAKSGAELDSAAPPAPLTNAHAPRVIPTISANFDMGHLALILSVYCRSPMIYSRYGSKPAIPSISGDQHFLNA